MIILFIKITTIYLLLSGTDRGLVVPVLKKADELSFADIERNIFLLSEKAKQGKITINDLQGGTFTISNGGIYGSVCFLHQF